jgi:hypothetical protein
MQVDIQYNTSGFITSFLKWELRMFVKAMSKQKFGEQHTPFINVDQIATVELGHQGNVNVKMSNGEELVVPADQAKLLIGYLEKNQLR